jgi:hypothetical protein
MTHTKPDETANDNVGILISEFVTDIRRRARAVECLIAPKSPSWTFDVDQLPTTDAGRLVAIKREVDRTFGAVFSDSPRARLHQTGTSGAPLRHTTI